MSLIGRWHLNESTGLIAPDSSGYGNDGVLSGTLGPNWVPGISGNALDFNVGGGLNNLVNMGNASPLDQLGNGDFSISFWMKSKDTVPLNYGALFSKTSANNSDIILIDSNGVLNHLRVVLRKNTGAVFSGIFQSFPFITAWVHVVLLFNRTTNILTLYQNNVKFETELDISSQPIDISNSEDIVLGSRVVAGYPYEGAEDEIILFNHLLSIAEIDYLFNNPGATPGPIVECKIIMVLEQQLSMITAEQQLSEITMEQMLPEIAAGECNE